MATGKDVIKTFMSSLDKTTLTRRDALDEAVRASSNFTSWQQVIDKMISDCSSYKGDGTKFLKEKCGINLQNEDTGAITGYDASSGPVKTAESVVPEVGSAVSPVSSSSTFLGLNVIWPDESSLTASQKYIIAGLNTWWIKNSLELVEDSYGLSFKEADAYDKTLNIEFVNENNSFLAAVSYSVLDGGNKILKINMNYYDNISLSDPNGVSSKPTAGYLDRTIAHEMTHAVMVSTINAPSALPHYFVEGMAELTHGIDDERKYDITRLAKDASWLERVLVDNVDAGSDSYAAGYMLLRYFAYQASNGEGAGAWDSDSESGSSDDSSSSSSSGLPTDASLSGTTMILNTSFSGSLWLDGWDFFSGKEVYKNASVSQVDASNVANSIILAGNSINNTLKGGSGNDSLWGGIGGNDTLIGGAGSDMFWFGKGCGIDTIQDFASGSNGDILTFFTDGLFVISRNDKILNIAFRDASKLNINVGTNVDSLIRYSSDGKNIQNVKLGNSYSENKFTYDKSVLYCLGGQRTDTIVVSGNDSSKVWLDGTAGNYFGNIENIDASSSSGTNELAGNDANNVISAGSGASSIFGGWGGNDTLIGGSGQDWFWYGKNLGNDVIENIGKNDVVNLFDAKLSDISGINLSNSDIYLMFNDGGSLKMIGATEAGNTFILGGEGTAWKYNNDSGNWYTV